MRFLILILSTVFATRALCADRTRSNAGVRIVASANSNPKSLARQSDQGRIVEEEDESAGDARQKGRGAEAESDRRHRDANPAANRRDRHHHHGRRSSANRRAEDPTRRGRAARKCPACRSRRAARPARYRRVDSRRDAVADAGPRRRGRSQRRRDRQLRFRQPDYRQSRSRRGSARRRRLAVRIAGYRRRRQLLSQEGEGAADSEPAFRGRQSRDQPASRNRQRRRGKSRLLGRGIVLLD